VPTSIIARSQVCPDAEYDIVETSTITGTVNSYGNDIAIGGVSALHRTWAYTALGNTLSLSVVGQQLQSTDQTLTSLTTALEPYGSGTSVNITFPQYKAVWGNPTYIGWLLTGSLREENTSSALTNYTVNPFVRSAADYNFPSSTPFSCAPTDSPATANWEIRSRWGVVNCGDPTILPDGGEPFVLWTKKPCDADYRDRWKLNTINNFHARSDAEFPYMGTRSGGFGQGHGACLYHDGSDLNMNGYTNFKNWILAQLTTSGPVTKSLDCWVGFPRNYGVALTKTYQTPGSSATYVYTVTTKVTVTGMQLIVYVGFDGETSVDNTAGEPVAVDVFEDKFIACAWTTASGTNGKKQLYIGIQPALTANIGSGSGSTSGWETYLFGDIDTRSEVGLCYLPNGNLEVMFDEYAGTVKTVRYIVNRNFGRKPLTNWSNRATVTADGSQSLSSGRAMGQGWKLRVGS